MRLQEIRKKYDQNYDEMVETISKMGGEKKIKDHRKKQTPLYHKLKELQRREHQLDSLENRCFHRQAVPV